MAQRDSTLLKNKGVKIKTFFTKVAAWLKFLLFVLGVGAAIYFPVYFNSHPFRSGDDIPHLIGIIGSVMMFVGAAFYVIRKRVAAFKKAGKIKYWLEAHILFCLVGPLLVVYHSAFSVLAPNSAIAYYAMLMVVGSGVAGRYIFRHFQLALSGERATLNEIAEEKEKLDEEIKHRFGNHQKILTSISRYFSVRENQENKGFFGLVFTMIRLDFSETKLIYQLRIYLSREERRKILDSKTADSLIGTRIRLEKKVSSLEMTAKLFSYWHKLHVPFLWLLIVTFIFHVAAVLIF
ncbi:MAG: hypothetical protein HY202_06765 [Nitrospirae bacterium]|nr:hypothetical protein [Nitrospirota bacterium]